MSDVLPLDRMTVNVFDEWERRYWARCFGCTEEQLVAAVKAAGTDHVHAVRQKLGATTTSSVQVPKGFRTERL
jgi:hypothetical protein